MSTLLSVYAGGGNVGTLWGLLETNQDGAEDYTPYLESADLYPYGMQNEAVFTGCWIMLTWDTEAVVRVTPVLDGVAYDGTNGTTDERTYLDLAAQTARRTQTFEVPLTRRLLDSYDGVTEIGRLAMRGQRIRLQVDLLGALGDGDLIFEGVLLEHEAALTTIDPLLAPNVVPT